MRIFINYSQSNFFINTFVDAAKHFRLAFCSSAKVQQLVAKGVIRNTPVQYLSDRLTFKERVQHLTLAILESVGICLLALCFLVDAIDRHLHISIALKRPKQAQTFNLMNAVLRDMETRPAANGFEYILDFVRQNPQGTQSIIQHFGLDDDNLMIDYRERFNTAAGCDGATTNVLLSYYFGILNNCPCLTQTGKYLENQDPKGKVVYFPEHTTSVSPIRVYEHVHGILKNELEKNPDRRPQKIIFPLSWDKNGLRHATLLIIEPSDMVQSQARITMINTNGDRPRTFLEFEKEAIRAASTVYNAAESTILRNQKPIYTTATSCAHDVLELACELAQKENVQQVVAKGLKRKSPEDDRNIRIKHGEDVVKFFDLYNECNSNF